jgi:hypothetical protein
VESGNWWRPILTNLRTGSLARCWEIRYKTGIPQITCKGKPQQSTVDRYVLRSSV